MTIKTRDQWQRPPAATASGGPNTSIALAGVQTVADGDTDAIVFDTEEATANLVAGVPTVPVDGEYWVVWSVLATTTGTTGTIRAAAKGSTIGELDTDEESAGALGFLGTLGGLRRVPLVAGETLTVEVHGTTGADVVMGGDTTGTFLQFWAA